MRIYIYIEREKDTTHITYSLKQVHMTDKLDKQTTIHNRAEVYVDLREHQQTS